MNRNVAPGARQSQVPSAPGPAGAGPHRALWTAIVGSAIIAWAAIFVRLADVSVATSATYRCAYALPALAFFALAMRRHPDASRRDRRLERAPRRLAALAGLGLSGRLLFWHGSIALVGAGMATALQNAQVALVPLAAWILLRERPSAHQLAALPVVLVGCVLISGVVGSGAYGSNPALGAALGLVAAVSYTLYQLAASESVTRGGSPIATLAVATAVSAVATGAFGVATGSLHAPVWPQHGWLLALGLVVQALGWGMITWAMATLSIATISFVVLIQPVGSIVLGYALLGEHPGGLQWVGVALTLAGIALAARPGRSGPVTEI